jgi:putative tryptophan/tyrosine transport system substrate-binding protein
MRRREFIVALGGATVAWPLTAHAQRRGIPLIGFLSSRSPAESATVVAAFREGLAGAGFIEGQTVSLEFRWAEGQYARLPALAAALVGHPVNLIVAAGGDVSAIAAKRATSTIPIVFTGSDDPVRSGLVTSLGRPGGNITGMMLFTSEVEAKKFALLHELIPSARNIAMIINPNNPSSETDIKDVQKAASSVAQQLRIFKATSEQEIDASFEALSRERADAILVAHDPFFFSRRTQLVSLAERHKLPAIYEFREFVTGGGLISYGNIIADNYRAAGVYVGRILNGADPADLPVVQPTKFEMVINLKTAKTLGLTVPPTLLARADEVIE